MELLAPVELVTLGWEHQRYFVVVSGEGMNDTRSGLFTNIVQLIIWVQSTFPTLGYVIVNTPFQFD
jgi:hypothetical protein